VEHWPRWVKYPLAALGAYCLIGALVMKNGWPVVLAVIVWPVVFNVIVNRAWPAKPPTTPPD
jgi:hypothetical protein